jgi:hypothetical protein
MFRRKFLVFNTRKDTNIFLFINNLPFLERRKNLTEFMAQVKIKLETDYNIFSELEESLSKIADYKHSLTDFQKKFKAEDIELNNALTKSSNNSKIIDVEKGRQAAAELQLTRATEQKVAAELQLTRATEQKVAAELQLTRATEQKAGS